MKIRRIALPVTELLRLEPAERNVLFLVGHINNEISSLTKIWGWCLDGAKVAGVSEIEAYAGTAQAMMYARLLAGKLLEAWGALEKSWFASKVGVEVARSLHPDAVKSLDVLKVYFGSKNLIYMVRNSFAFHYDPAALGQHWEQAAQEPFFEIVIGINRGNSFNQASELVANIAVFQTVTSGDPHAGMASFLEEINFVSGHFQIFCEGVARALIERLSGSNLDELGSLSDVTPAKKFSEVSIPVFYQPDEDLGHVLP